MPVLPQLEIRSFELTEVRSENSGNTLVGYAAVFNSLSADLGGFQERIIPGAFAASLASKQDIRALVNHDYAALLGRTTTGTLRVAEDAKGLRVEIDLPQTSYANDLRALMVRGDIRGMSFGFRVPEGGDRFTSEAGQTIRELTAIDLREVTVTSIPAYIDTECSIRTDPGIATRVAAYQGRATEKKSWEINLANLHRHLQTM